MTGVESGSARGTGRGRHAHEEDVELREGWLDRRRPEPTERLTVPGALQAEMRRRRIRTGS